MNSVPDCLSHFAKPGSRYKSVTVHGKIAYVSGQVSRAGSGVSGGKSTSADTLFVAVEAARVSACRCLAALHGHFGSLDVVEKVLMVRGFIGSAPDFTRHSEVRDAASDLIVGTLGERGFHARAAIGVSILPGGLTEIEMTVALSR